MLSLHGGAAGRGSVGNCAWSENKFFTKTGRGQNRFSFESQGLAFPQRKGFPEGPNARAESSPHFADSTVAGPKRTL